MGDALLKAGEKEQARAAYVAVLERDPASACATQGLERINAATPSPNCTAADALFDAGKLDPARSAYEAVGSGVDCATAGVAAIRDVLRLCAQGHADLTLDRATDALDAYKAALAKNPKAPCAIKGVQSAGPGWLANTMDALSTWLPRALAGVGILILALFLLLLLGYIPAFYRVLAHLPVIRQIVGPRLTLEDLKDAAPNITVGGPLAVRIKERLLRFREEASIDKTSDYDLDFGRVGEEFADLVSTDKGLQNSLDKVRDLSDNTKTIASLIDFLYGLLPVRRLDISGVVEPPTGYQTSTTLALQNGGRLASAVTLTGPRLAADPVASDYLALADPAAVWVQYAVAQVLSGDRIESDKAESYALVQEGLDRHLAGNEDDARMAFRGALALDPRNWAAIVNLAVTEARLGNRYERSVEILKEAVEERRRAR